MPDPRYFIHPEHIREVSPGKERLPLTLRDTPQKLVYLIVLVILSMAICSSGCTSLPPLHKTTINASNASTPPHQNLTSQTPTPQLPSTTPTPPPIPTSSVNKTEPVYSAPYIEPTQRVSVGYLSTMDGRNKTHVVYTEKGIDLHEEPLARNLDILNGPFTVQCTVHPKVQNPNYSWAVFTLRDPWGNTTAQGGYNRRYTNNSVQEMTVFKTGRFHLTLEGDFVTVDLSLLTTDPVISQTPTPTPNREAIPPQIRSQMPLDQEE